MAKKIETRISNKHDFEINWIQAKGFVPLDGELIIYDKETDENGNILTTKKGQDIVPVVPLSEENGGRTTPIQFFRIKIGDGKNTVNNLPFFGEQYNDINKIPDNIKDGEGNGALEQLHDSETWTGIDANGNEVNYETKASGKFSAIYGGKSYAEGGRSLAGGTKSVAKGSGSLAFGDTNYAGDYATAFGYQTRALGAYSHTEGRMTVTKESNAHAEGSYTEAKGNSSHAEGSETISGGLGSHAEGVSTEAKGGYSHAEGKSTIADGFGSHAEGEFSVANGGRSHAEGQAVYANGNNSHAEGSHTEANGENSHAEGSVAYANGENSHAEGNNTIADGNASHAEGSNTKASQDQAHAEGWETEASGHHSHSEGQQTKAIGDNSHAGGRGTIAAGEAQTVIGRYNEENSDALFIIGNGDDDDNRKNAFVVNGDGSATIQTTGTEDNNVVNYGQMNEVLGETFEQLGGVIAKDFVTQEDFDYAMEFLGEELSNQVGQSSSANGAEIFNDYNNNQALGKYSTASGLKTTAGTMAKGFSILNIETENIGMFSSTTNFYFELSTVEGIESGDSITIYSQILGETIEITEKINSVSMNTISVTLNNGYEIATGGYTGEKSLNYDKLIQLANKINGSTDEYLIISNKPELVGDRGSGTAAHAEGYQTWAISEGSHAEGYTTIAGGNAFTVKEVIEKSTEKLVRLFVPASVLSGCNLEELRLRVQFTHEVYEGTYFSILGTDISSRNIVPGVAYDLGQSTQERYEWAGSYLVDEDFSGNPVEGGYSIGESFRALKNNPANSAGGFMGSTGSINTQLLDENGNFDLTFKIINNSQQDLEIVLALMTNNQNSEPSLTLYNKYRSSAKTYTTNEVSLQLEDNIDITGIEVDDIFSLYSNQIGTNLDYYGKITAINDNKLSVDKLPEELNSIQTDKTTYIWFPYKPYLKGNVSIGAGSHAGGYETIAIPFGAHSEGYNTNAGGKYSHAEGNSTKAGYAGHAQNLETEALGIASSAQGTRTKATGRQSDANGFETIASGDNSTSNGYKTDASGDNSDAGGSQTLASGNMSFTRGLSTKATADRAFAIGNETVASEKDTFAAGWKTKATRWTQAVVGMANKEDEYALFIVGNGSGDGDDQRKNAFVVKSDGSARLAKGGTANDSVVNYAQMREYVAANGGKSPWNAQSEMLFSTGEVQIKNGTDEYSGSISIGYSENADELSIDSSSIGSSSKADSGYFSLRHGSLSLAGRRNDEAAKIRLVKNYTTPNDDGTEDYLSTDLTIDVDSITTNGKSTTWENLLSTPDSIQELQNKTDLLDNVLRDILTAIRSNTPTAETVSAIEQTIVSYLENKTISEVEE